MSLPPFYANTAENIRAKEYKYDDVVHKLKDYVAARQKLGEKKPGLGDGQLRTPLPFGLKKTNLRKSANTAEPNAGRGQDILNWSASPRSMNKEESRSPKLLPTQIVTNRRMDQYMRM
jgi:hypothetical protein